MQQLHGTLHPLPQRPLPRFPFIGERFPSLAHFHFAVASACYAHHYPLAPPPTSSRPTTATLRCPLSAPSSSALAAGTRTSHPCSFAFTAHATSRAGDATVVVTLASGTHSCASSWRAAEFRACAARARVELEELRAGARYQERGSGAAQRESEREKELRVCRARELDGEQAWVDEPAEWLPLADGDEVDEREMDVDEREMDVDEVDTEAHDRDVLEEADYAARDNFSWSSGGPSRIEDGGIDPLSAPLQDEGVRAALVRPFKPPFPRAPPPPPAEHDAFDNDLDHVSLDGARNDGGVDPPVPLGGTAQDERAFKPFSRPLFRKPSSWPAQALENAPNEAKRAPRTKQAAPHVEQASPGGTSPLSSLPPSPQQFTPSSNIVPRLGGPVVRARR
ncbi:hypothetical protein JCM10450v2_002077 [Rhodotorula kratochvilovae]